jgi:hypothetical protein
MEDFYCDGDVAPLGRLNYVYQNYIPGVSQITYPDPEPETEAPTETPTEDPTEDPTEAPTAPSTEAPTDTVTDTEISTDEIKKGCGSTVMGSALLLALTAFCGTALLKKKD